MSLELTLSPPVATAIFVLACWGGYQYRRTWKASGPAWRLWAFGLIAAASLLALGFLPLAAPV